MDEQILALIEATRAQTKIEEERQRLDRERIENEKTKINLLNDILAETRRTNHHVNEELLPAARITTRLMPVLLEIQRVVILRVVSSSNQEEEIKRLKELLPILATNDFNFNVGGSVDNITGQRK